MINLTPASKWSEIPYNARVFMTLSDKNIPNMMIECRYLPNTNVYWSDVTKLEKESKIETVSFEELVSKFKPISYIEGSERDNREFRYNYTAYCGKQLTCVIDIMSPTDENGRPIEGRAFCFKCKRKIE